MALDRITLARFRNHTDTRLERTRQFNLLVGENGAGKTNILEALSLLAPGRGLRRAPLVDIAQADAGGGFAVGASLTVGSDEPVRLATHSAPARPNRRLVQVNGASTSAVSLGEWLAISWLTPAMDRLFSDSAGARRRYMDRLALALDPLHARHASRYEASLRERNRLLGEDRPVEPEWFDAVEKQMAEHGALLSAGRQCLVEKLQQALSDLPQEPFARPALTYFAAGATDADSLQQALAAGRGRDLAAQRTLTGPHRDELEVRMAGKDVPAASCSTGEQKALLIALTLAHAELAAGERPGLLLLDEVAAHLDPVRREALFDRLSKGSAQVWMTGTEQAPFADITDEAAIWRVLDGTIERV